MNEFPFTSNRGIYLALTKRYRMGEKQTSWKRPVPIFSRLDIKTKVEPFDDMIF